MLSLLRVFGYHIIYVSIGFSVPGVEETVYYVLVKHVNVHQIDIKPPTILLPISIPKMIHAKMDSSSFLADLFIIGKSQMTRP